MDLSDTMSVKEACAYLHVSSKTIYRWVDSGKLPAQKIGLQFFIKRDAVESIASGRGVYIDNLVQRIDNLEQRLAELEAHAESPPAPRAPLTPPTTRSEPAKPPVAHPGAIRQELPEGTLHIRDLLATHNLKSHRRRIIGYLDTPAHKLTFHSYPKPNRPAETDRFLEPAQQEALLTWLHFHHPDVFTSAGEDEQKGPVQVVPGLPLYTCVIGPVSCTGCSFEGNI